MTEIFSCRPPEPWKISAKLYFDTPIANSGTTRKQLYTIWYWNSSRLYVLSEDSIVESEYGIITILSNLKNLWQHRATLEFEGNSYSVGDFIVRMANPTGLVTKYQGMLVEVC